MFCRVTSAIIDFHIDEIQTRIFKRKFNVSVFTHVCQAFVQPPRVAEHSSVMSIALVSSYIRE
jgi:hypothetical protein